MTTDSQSKKILDYLRLGRKLTALDALKLFGCFRLSARIYELREAGHPIGMKIVPVSGDKHVAEYHLKQEEDERSTGKAAE